MTIRILRNALAAALLLVSAQAAALGLGQIEVRSKLNQPLLAEIPVIYSDPAELEQLQARLASPETFARVGLEPPQGTVADLQFAVALDARGQTVIRVTSSQPVNTSLLVFLVEVDSGQSRVVREYSALIDVPRNAPIAAGPVIQAPQVAMPDTVTRAPVVSAPAVTPLPDAPIPDAPPPAVPPPATPPPVAAQPDPNAIPVAPSPVAVMPQPPAAAPTPAATPGEYGPVKPGQTLSEIAGELGSGYSLDQTMIALLRTNPDAFIGDDINFIKRGAVLRVPQPAEISGLSPAEASMLVQGQVERWREARQPAPQPVEAASADTSAAPSARPATPTARRVADARLEIVPSASSRGTQAGTRSGASAGGEGEMLRQQLQQNKEDLAARGAEVVELQARIAELEKLQQQQGELLTLKDSELAAAQQRLAESNRGTAAAAPATTATATQPVQPAPEPAEGELGWLWPLGFLVLALAALLGWWFSRRRRVPDPPARRAFDTESLAAGFPATAAAGVEPASAVSAASAEPAKPARAPRRTAPGNGRRTTTVTPTPVTGGSATDAPVSRAAAIPVPQPPAPEIAPPLQAPAWTTTGQAAPTWHAGNVPPPASSRLTPPKAALGHESIELARAYIDLGDDDTARSLLQEVIDIGDADARTAAARMLRELP